MRHRLGAGAAMCAAALLIAQPAPAIVSGNADFNRKHYLRLATDPEFRYGNEFGSVAYDPAFSSVGQIYGERAGGAFAASGVLIDDHWVLTAAHVTAGATQLRFWLDSGGTNFSRPGYLLADRVLTHPLWQGQLNAGYDLGLFHLSAPAACLAAGTCAAADFDEDAIAPANQALAVQVGFGRTGVGRYGADSFDGLKRAGTNQLDAYYPNSQNNILLADFDSGRARDNYYGTTTRTVMEAIVAPGDSGGALFDAEGELLGITSFIWGLDGNSNSDFGDVGGWSRVAFYREWIDCVLAGSAVCGSSTFGAVTVGAVEGLLNRARVPEPSVLVLFGLALAGLLAGHLANASRLA